MEDKDFIQVKSYSSAPISELEAAEFVPYNPLNRPPVHYAKPIIALILYVALFVGICFIPVGAWWIRALMLIGYSLIYFSLIAKRAVIWMVHLYQNKASDETRLKCAFEPSCSEYMILAVRKYGVIRGVLKGINRLSRCGKESGIDYP